MSDFASVIKSGNRADSLRALRDLLADEIDGCDSARDVAALTRLLKDVLDAIEGLPDPKEDSASERIRKRRAARRPDSSDSGGPEGAPE